MSSKVLKKSRENVTYYYIKQPTNLNFPISGGTLKYKVEFKGQRRFTATKITNQVTIPKLHTAETLNNNIDFSIGMGYSITYLTNNIRKEAEKLFPLTTKWNYQTVYKENNDGISNPNLRNRCPPTPDVVLFRTTYEEYKNKILNRFCFSQNPFPNEPSTNEIYNKRYISASHIETFGSPFLFIGHGYDIFLNPQIKQSHIKIKVTISAYYDSYKEFTLNNILATKYTKIIPMPFKSSPGAIYTDFPKEYSIPMETKTESASAEKYLKSEYIIENINNAYIKSNDLTNINFYL